MPIFRSTNAQALAVVQGAAGTEGAPAPATDGVRVYGGNPIGYGLGFTRLDTNYANSSLTDSSPVVSPGQGSMKLAAYLTPSDNPGGAGTPDFGTLLQGCAMSATRTLANVSGTAQAGASGQLTLAAGASAVNDAYKGMTITLTGGTGGATGQRRVITGYVGSTKVASVFPNFNPAPDATTTYTINRNILWSPITTGISFLTLWGYQHASASGGLSRRRRLMDAVGNMTMALKPRQYASMDFAFTGVVPAAPDDVAKPFASTIFGLDPQPAINGNFYLGGSGTSATATRIKFTDGTFDLGNRVGQFDDPNAAYGFDTPDIVGRDSKITLTLNTQDIATRDSVATAIAMTNAPLWMTWGAALTGVSIFFPAVRITNPVFDDSGGWQVDKLELDATGADAEVYISIF